MYSYEIDNFLRDCGYRISSDDYLHICSTSPQIKEIHHDTWNDRFSFATDDGYYLEFEIYLK